MVVVLFIIPTMQKPRIVIDTNVFVSALLSQRGASYLLLMLADSDLFEVNLSVPLVLEYEDAANRILHKTPLSKDDLNTILDYLCAVGNKKSIYYLWRPLLHDPRDEMVLELAITANCQYIVTFNQKDFAGAENFEINLITSKEFLQHIGQLL